MTPFLFDPLNPPPQAWPEGQEAERHFIDAVAQAGVTSLVSNVQTRWYGLRSGDRVFPVTVNDLEQGHSYVCLPHSAYFLYALRELDLIHVGWLKPLLRLLIQGAERLMRNAELNRIVHVDNWLLSTNLHGDWQGAGITAIRELLVRSFPRHIIAIRSVDPWSSPELLAAAQADGWMLIPSRQIWVTDDIKATWSVRRDIKHDRKILRASGLHCETLRAMNQRDAERIAELYAMLYLDKYSDLNPAFTAQWISMTHRQGLIAYHAARDAAGSIQAVAGTITRWNCLTTPIVGYDFAQPQSAGLYRIACLMAGDATIAAGARMNSSSGAARFKRNRGAHAVIEYSAFYVRHLAKGRQRRIAAMRWILNQIAVPFLKWKQL